MGKAKDHQATGDRAAGRNHTARSSASRLRHTQHTNAREAMGSISSLAMLGPKTRAIFHTFHKEVFSAGALDRKTKELIAVAASAVAGCEGCLIGHVRKARALGASEDELNETIAVAFAVNAATVVDRSDVAAAMLKSMSQPEAGPES